MYLKGNTIKLKFVRYIAPREITYVPLITRKSTFTEYVVGYLIGKH